VSLTLPKGITKRNPVLRLALLDILGEPLQSLEETFSCSSATIKQKVNSRRKGGES